MRVATRAELTSRRNTPHRSRILACLLFARALSRASLPDLANSVRPFVL